MPIYNFAKYVQHRKDTSRCSAYGICVPKDELFSAGGRPVIYGLSSNMVPLVKDTRDIRIIKPDILPVNEQYRYVAYNPNRKPYSLDWSHEREWRWKPNEKDEVYFIDGDGIGDFEPALPLFRGKENDGYFTRVGIIVWTREEAKEIADLLTCYRDSGCNNYSEPFVEEVLKNTFIVVLIDVVSLVEEAGMLSAQRIEDLPSKALQTINRPKSDPALREKVKIAVEKAIAASVVAASEYAKTAPRTKDGHIADACGFASVVTYDSNTAIIDAMLELGIAQAIGGLYYSVSATGKIGAEQSISYREAAAEAAADVLTAELGQNFYCHSRLD